MVVKLGEVTPVYVINSFSTAIVPEAGKPVVDVKATEVPLPPVPAVSAFKAPSKSFVKVPVMVPP